MPGAKTRLICWGACLFIFCANASAQNQAVPADAQAEHATPPCSSQPEHRQFDLWVGEWDVQDARGRPVGASRIERVEGGCVIQENWAGGGTGRSLNFYDANLRKWRQTWADDAGGVSEFAGVYRDGAMRFEGESHTPEGARVLRRLTFFDLGADRVRQFSEASKDGGKTWASNYDFVYVRKHSAATAARVCMDTPEYRGFDFWLGDWNVFDPQGRQVGTNRVVLLADGCIVEENWEGARGGVGKSFNFYNPATRRWHQSYMDNGGNNWMMDGELKDGVLRYEGAIYSPGGKQVLVHMTFYDLGAGKVRQTAETSADGGKTWTPVWDGTYVRKK